MTNNAPLHLSIAVTIALLIYIGSSYLLNCSVKIDYQEIRPKTLVLHNDVISTSPRLNKIPSHNFNEGSLKKKQEIVKGFYNLFPSTLTWITFHSSALSLGAATCIFLLYLMYNMQMTFRLRIPPKKWEKLNFLSPLLITLAAIGLFLWLVLHPQAASLFTGAHIMVYFKIVFKDPEFVVSAVAIAFTILGIFPLFGMTLMNMCIRKLHASRVRSQNNYMKKYLMLHDNLNVFAFSIGLLVSIPILGTKLQKAMIAEHLIGNIDFIYPDQFISAYGISCSLILGLFLLPSLAYLRFVKKEKNLEIPSEKSSTGWWSISKETIDDAKLILAASLPLLTGILNIFQ